MSNYLGVEFGSTRIKAVVIDDAYEVVSSGDFTWKSGFENGIWTYDLADAWTGLKTALRSVTHIASVEVVGISAMMHGYLAFDREWKLLTPFRTWQNTVTAEAAAILTDAFGFNIPQRWSGAHLFQAILNGEPHVKDVSHITTLAGYIHYMLTGKNVLGIGDASGMFPIDPETKDYDRRMLETFDALTREKGFKRKLYDLLPRVLSAGEEAGSLSEEGARLIDNLLPAGVPFAPPEGDAGTGMVATNAISPRTGNVSAGTSIFSMVVLEHSLKKVYPEIDIVTTPVGAPVAMVHCNNCTGDMNAWVSLFYDVLTLFDSEVSQSELFTKLYQKSLSGDADCGGITVCNYLAGEGVTHFDQGKPFVIRNVDGNFTLANLLRAHLYSTMSTMRIGMDLLAEEQVGIDRLTGHGGLFKTPVVGQRLMAAACAAPITCMETAGEGGPYGMALLAAYLKHAKHGGTLETFLEETVFANTAQSIIEPDAVDITGFDSYLERFKKILEIEQAAITVG